VRFDEKETFRHFDFARTPEEEQAAKVKGTELAEQFAIQATVRNAQLFLQALKNRAREIPNLISPHLGDRLTTSWTIVAAVFSSNRPMRRRSRRQCHCRAASWRTHQGRPLDDQLRMLKSKTSRHGGRIRESAVRGHSLHYLSTAKESTQRQKLLAPCQPRLIQKQNPSHAAGNPAAFFRHYQTKTPHFSRSGRRLTFRETMGQFRVIHESSPRTSAPIFWSPRWALAALSCFCANIVLRSFTRTCICALT